MLHTNPEVSTGEGKAQALNLKRDPFFSLRQMIMIQLFVQLYRDFPNSFEMSKEGELSQEELLGTHSSLERKKSVVVRLRPP